MNTVLSQIIVWSIAAVPFFIAIAPAPANVFMGFVIVFYLIKKAVVRESVIPKSGMTFALLLFFIVVCVSIIHSVSLKDSLRGGVFRLLQFMFVLFAVASEIKTKKQYWIVFISIASGLFLVSLDSIWQTYTMKDFIRGYAPVVNLGLVRATASFKDSNTLGVYLSGFAPLVLGVTLYYLCGKKRLGMILLNALILAGILLTYSRPTLLAFYITLWLFALIKKSRLLILALLIVTVLSPFMLPGSVKHWAKQVDYNLLRFMCNDDRIAIYRNTLNMIKQHPVIGVGTNTYMKNYRFYKEVPEYRNIITTDYAYAHNNFLHLTAETGLLGLFSFLLLLVMIFWEGGKIYRQLADPFLKTYALSLLVCIAAFLVNGLTESSLFHSRVAAIFWYLIGLLLSLSKGIPPEKVTQPT